MKKRNLESKYRAFKKEHPNLHMAGIIVALLCPFCISVFIVLLFDGIEGRAILALYAMAGSIVLGMGLVLAAMTDFNKEVFWRVDIYPIAIGFLIVFTSLLGFYNEMPYLTLESSLLEFQAVSFLLCFFFGVFYLINVREAISVYLSVRTHLNESQLDKRKKGLLNFLWYRKVHQEFGIGWIYYVNATVTLVLLVLLLCSILLVLFKNIAGVVVLLCLLVGGLTIILDLFSIAVSIKHKKYYLKIKKRMKILNKIPYSYDVIQIAITLCLCWVQIRAFLTL